MSFSSLYYIILTSFRQFSMFGEATCFPLLSPSLFLLGLARRREIAFEILRNSIRFDRCNLSISSQVSKLSAERPLSRVRFERHAHLIHTEVSLRC